PPAARRPWGAAEVAPELAYHRRTRQARPTARRPPRLFAPPAPGRAAQGHLCAPRQYRRGTEVPSAKIENRDREASRPLADQLLAAAQLQGGIDLGALGLGERRGLLRDRRLVGVLLDPEQEVARLDELALGK